MVNAPKFCLHFSQYLSHSYHEHDHSCHLCLLTTWSTPGPFLRLIAFRELWLSPISTCAVCISRPSCVRLSSFLSALFNFSYLPIFFDNIWSPKLAIASAKTLSTENGWISRRQYFWERASLFHPLALLAERE